MFQRDILVGIQGQYLPSQTCCGLLERKKPKDRKRKTTAAAILNKAISGEDGSSVRAPDFHGWAHAAGSTPLLAPTFSSTTVYSQSALKLNHNMCQFCVIGCTVHQKGCAIRAAGFCNGSSCIRATQIGKIASS